jgi:hypothetical protein
MSDAAWRTSASFAASSTSAVLGRKAEEDDEWMRPPVMRAMDSRMDGAAAVEAPSIERDIKC